MNKMTVERFIIGYKNAKDKEAYIKKHVKDAYVPYEEKIAVCEKIVEATSYVEIAGQKIFKQNTPARFVMFSLYLMKYYTDLEIDMNNSLSVFNELNRVNLINDMVKFISNTEYIEFSTLLDMVQADDEENNRSLTSLLESFMLIISKMSEDNG